MDGCLPSSDTPSTPPSRSAAGLHHTASHVRSALGEDRLTHAIWRQRVSPGSSQRLCPTAYPCRRRAPSTVLAGRVRSPELPLAQAAHRTLAGGLLPFLTTFTRPLPTCPRPRLTLRVLRPAPDFERAPAKREGARADESGAVLSAIMMFRRFEHALKHALREENFAAILGSAVTLIVVGTLAYTFGEDWSVVDGFYFAVATLTTSSIADPDLVITNSWLKIFTVFYILIGIGILVEVARQLGGP